MWWMSISIDVVFLRVEFTEERGVVTERKVVTSTYANVRPWKFLPLNDRKANETLELPTGSIGKIGIAVGDVLCIG